jgi:hypothetical protein
MDDLLKIVENDFQNFENLVEPYSGQLLCSTT